MQVDLWVLFVWPIVVFLVGTALVSLTSRAWNRIEASRRQRRVDQIISARLAAGTLDQADDVTLGDVVSYEKRHPGMDLGQHGAAR